MASLTESSWGFVSCTLPRGRCCGKYFSHLKIEHLQKSHTQSSMVPEDQTGTQVPSWMSPPWQQIIGCIWGVTALLAMVVQRSVFPEDDI